MEKDCDFLEQNKDLILMNLLQAEIHLNSADTRLRTGKGIEPEHGSCVLKHLLIAEGEALESVNHCRVAEPAMCGYFAAFRDKINKLRKEFEKNGFDATSLEKVRKLRKEFEKKVQGYDTEECELCSNIGEYLKNKEDVMKLGDVVKASDLPPEKGYTMETDSQDIKATAESIGWKDELPTGAIVKIGEGEYDEVWFTWDSKPYLNSASYELMYKADEGLYKEDVMGKDDEKQKIKQLVDELIKERDKAGHALVIFDSATGKYIPKEFCQKYGFDCCQDPDDEFYYENWEDLLDKINEVASEKGYVLETNPHGDLIGDLIFGKISDFGEEEEEEEISPQDAAYMLISLATSGNLQDASEWISVYLRDASQTDIDKVKQIFEMVLKKFADMYKITNEVIESILAKQNLGEAIGLLTDLRTDLTRILLDPVSQSTISKMEAKGCKLLPHPICVMSKESEGMSKDEAGKKCIAEGKIHGISLLKCKIQ